MAACSTPRKLWIDYSHGRYDRVHDTCTVTSLRADPRCAYALGAMLYYGQGGPADYASAAARFQAAVALGHLPSMLMLGEMYYKGQGVEKDAEKATALWHRAEEGGDRNAAYRLYIYGAESGAEPAANRRWLARAADAGVTAAQVTLGNLLVASLSSGEKSSGIRYLEAAAKTGNVQAKMSLAQALYADSSYERALALFRDAASRGNAHAQFMLGTMYAAGQGVPRDDQESYSWLSVARAAQSQPAAITLAGVDSELDAATRARYRKRASELGASIRTLPRRQNCPLQAEAFLH